MAGEPPNKKLCLDTGQPKDDPEGAEAKPDEAEATATNAEGNGGEGSLDARIWGLYSRLEGCLPLGCLCGVGEEEVASFLLLSRARIPPKYSQLEPNTPGHDLVLVYLSLLTWLGDSFHCQLVEGRVCSTLHSAARLVTSPSTLSSLVVLLTLPQPPASPLHYSSSRALSSLLPLLHCGREEEEEEEGVGREEEGVLERVVKEAFPPERDVVGERGLLEELGVEEEAGLGGLEEEEEEVQGGGREEEKLQYRAWLVSVLCGCVTHSSGGGGEEGGRGREGCEGVEVGEETLCQEVAVRCSVVRCMEGVWPQFTSSLLQALQSPGSSHAQVYLTEGFRLWQHLLSARTSLSFLSSRPFSPLLPPCLPLLLPSTPPPVWRAVLDTANEVLCYGTTLALMSSPPEEPCQLAHSLIRLVRFHSFLTRIPHAVSSGFGGESSPAWDRGLVCRAVLIVLKCVALTTREARVESSSGESDSSLSSLESVGSGGSDLVIIERTMSGMYRKLDSWIKTVLPLSPHSSLQQAVLHILQEQDDGLVEGLLCLLDTHVALYPSGGRREPEEGVLDTCPTTGFLTLLDLVTRDSSVLLDFLVSNETCFLLYLLRLLKFLLRDWGVFMETAGDTYTEAVTVLLDLKTSISRLLSKSLFPYNIGPVYRLLERVEVQHNSLGHYS